jgi:D-alanyl-D-alanine carboxypeptidase
MAQSQSPIWKKKRQRKFKRSKQTQTTSQAQPVKKAPILPPAPVVEKNAEATKKVSFFSKLFTRKPKEAKKKEEKTPSVINQKVGIWFQSHDSDIQLILFPLILLVILIILSLYNNRILLSVPQAPNADSQTTSLHPYPYVQSVSDPYLSAKTAIILDRDSQVILYSKNPEFRFSMASTTKIMTGTIALSYFKPDDILTVRRSYVEGSGLQFYAGEQFHFIDLMYAMLLPSANDAAQAIADNYPGGSDAFVKKMNEKVQSLHLSNTHYGDPIGLDDDGDYTTVLDLARLASYAIANPLFVEVTSTKEKTINSIQGNTYPLTNLNQLLGIDGVTGIKTGTTEGAGEVLVTSVVKHGHTYIIVVMNSTDRFADTRRLIDFIDENVKYIVPTQPAQ